MKYRLKKKMALLLAASMIASQSNFVFANGETSTDKNSTVLNDIKPMNTTTSESLEFLPNSITSDDGAATFANFSNGLDFDGSTLPGSYEISEDGSSITGQGNGDQFCFSSTEKNSEGEGFS